MLLEGAHYITHRVINCVEIFDSLFLHTFTLTRLRLCPSRDTHQKNFFQYKEVEICSHVFLRRIAIAQPLTAPYDGPYKDIVRNGRVMKILIKGKVETVSVAQVKPAHFECEPETGTATKRKMQSKTTNSKTTEIVHRTQKD